MPAAYGLVPGLNGLRAVSILLVLIGHFAVPEQFKGISALGVFLFFAISGFLITRLLFAENKKFGNINLMQFYYRRYLRLYPVLIFYILFFSAIYYIYGDDIQIFDILSVLFYFTNYLHNHYVWHGGDFSFPISALWSLAVEEHFYLFMPFLFILVRGNARKLVGLALLFCVLPLLVRCLYVYLWPEIIGTEFVYRPSETRFDSIAIGVLIAALCELERGRRYVRAVGNRAGLVVGLALLLLAFAYKGEAYGDTLRYTIRNIGCGLIVAATVFGKDIALFQKIANLRAVDGIGRISYSLYIWQGGVVTLMIYAGINHEIGGGWPIIAGAFVLAILSYKWVEQPALRFKNLGVRAQPAAPDQAAP